jgi:hypothetical protein
MSSPAFTVLRRSAPPALTFAERHAQRIAANPDGAAAARPAGLGDALEKLAKPIAKALRLPCLSAADRLQPESNCAKRRDALNRAFPFKP